MFGADPYRFWGIFWIDASTGMEITRDMLKVAGKLDLEDDIPSVLRYLSSTEETWLLNFDNVDDPSTALSKYFPVRGRGTMLITSRNAESKIHATVGCSDVGQ